MTKITATVYEQLRGQFVDNPVGKEVSSLEELWAALQELKDASESHAWVEIQCVDEAARCTSTMSMTVEG